MIYFTTKSDIRHYATYHDPDIMQLTHDIPCLVSSPTVKIGYMTCRICDFMRLVVVFRSESVVLQVSTKNLRASTR